MSDCIKEPRDLADEIFPVKKTIDTAVDAILVDPILKEVPPSQR